MTVDPEDRISAFVAADPMTVWELVSDITRMGQWSPECRRCEWIDGATGPVAGARFRGHNRMGPVRWSLTGDVKVADRGRQFTFATVDHGREGTRWTYRFEPSGSTTKVIESYEVVYEPWYIRILDQFAPRRRALRKGMERTLRQLKAAAEHR